MEENRKRGALSVNMTEGPLWKNMLLFSLPLMLTQVLEVLFNLSDVANFEKKFPKEWARWGPPRCWCRCLRGC